MNTEIKKTTKLWNFISSTRVFISNIFFLIILLIISISILSMLFLNKVPDPTNKALIFNPTGPIVEQIEGSLNPFSEILGDATPKELSLRKALKILNYVKEDNRFEYIILSLDNIQGTGQTVLFDLGQALQEVKNSGKKIIATGDYYDQSSYYLASFANEIIMNPDGGLFIQGYSRYRNYYKSFLEKLKISMNLFRVGTYKSAMEPYIRDDMSDEDKKASKEWMKDLWDSWKEEVALNRNLKPSDIQYFADNLNLLIKDKKGDFGKTVLKAKLVDKLLNRTESREYLSKIIGPSEEENESFANISIEEYWQVINSEEGSSNIPNNIAVIVAKGNIIDGDQPPGVIGGDSTARLIRNAVNNKEVKAIVLRIDSGGGSAFASEVIREEIVAAKKQNIPVIASMANVAASGGYWISASADEIWASHDTITGSIGIFGVFPTFEGSLEYIGIHSDGIGTTKFSGSLNPARSINPSLAEVMQSNVEHGYLKFITLVGKERKMSLEDVDSIAQGRVWSGKKALEIGLVDKLGDLSGAIARAAELANLKEYKVFFPEERKDWKQELIESLLGQALNLINSTFNLKIYSKNSMDMLKKLDIFENPRKIYAICMDCLIY